MRFAGIPARVVQVVVVAGLGWPCATLAQSAEGGVPAQLGAVNGSLAAIQAAIGTLTTSVNALFTRLGQIEGTVGNAGNPPSVATGPIPVRTGDDVACRVANVGDAPVVVTLKMYSANALIIEESQTVAAGRILSRNVDPLTGTYFCRFDSQNTRQIRGTLTLTRQGAPVFSTPAL